MTKISRVLTSILVAMAMLVGVFTSGSVLADEVVKVVEKNKIKVVVFKIGDYNYYLENTDGSIIKVRMDAAPYIKQGRTFVPVRFLANALGLTDDKIYWDGAKQEVALEGAKLVHMQIGNKTMYSNYKPIVMDVVPEIIPPGRTMLLARYVAEGLGFKVDWDPSRQLVICYPEEKAKPDLEKIIEEIEGKKPVEELVEEPVEEPKEEPVEQGTVAEKFQQIGKSGGFTSEDQLDKEMCDYILYDLLGGSSLLTEVSGELWNRHKNYVMDIENAEYWLQMDVKSLLPLKYIATKGPGFDRVNGNNVWYFVIINNKMLAKCHVIYGLYGYEAAWLPINVPDIFNID